MPKTYATATGANFGGLPTTSNVDWVRLTIGDLGDNAGTAGFWLTDAMITAAVTEGGNKRLGAAICCDWLAALFAREHDHSTANNGATSITESYSQKYDHYKELAATLRTRSTLIAAVPMAGGISRADKESAESDTDRVAAPFWRGQFDDNGETNPDTGGAV